MKNSHEKSEHCNRKREDIGTQKNDLSHFILFIGMILRNAKIAAEFLVPENILNKIWSKIPDIKYASGYFKVSEIVIARRALDTGKITRNQFYEFYEEYSDREFTKKETQSPGGDFYATTRKRLSMTFATHIHNAVKSGKFLFRDAYRLTSLKGDTFHRFFTML